MLQKQADRDPTHLHSVDGYILDLQMENGDNPDDTMNIWYAMCGLLVIMIKNAIMENKFRLLVEQQVVFCKPNTWCKSK